MKKIEPQCLPDIKQIQSFADADKVLLAIAKIESAVQEKEATLNAELQKLRAVFELQTAEQTQMKEMLSAQLEKFVIANKNEFEKERSREMMHGIIGLRRSTPKIAMLNRKYNSNTVLKLLKKVKWGKPLLRTKEEIDKEKLLAAHAGKQLNDEKLAAVGLKVDATENFFYNINWDTLQ